MINWKLHAITSSPECKTANACDRTKRTSKYVNTQFAFDGNLYIYIYILYVKDIYPHFVLQKERLEKCFLIEITSSKLKAQASRSKPSRSLKSSSTLILEVDLSMEYWKPLREVGNFSFQSSEASSYCMPCQATKLQWVYIGQGRAGTLHLFA
jgi:hypothetical protein